jgi:AraC-like DNA-binding protein
MIRDIGPARGVLAHEPGPGTFHHARIAPCEALCDRVQHFWAVRWDLRGHAPQTRESLPHPNIHLVFGPDGGVVHGVHSGRFTTVLEDQAGVFGVKFRPGGFRDVFGQPASILRDRSLPLAEVLPGWADTWAGIDPMQDERANIAVAERALLAWPTRPDKRALLAAEIVDAIATDRQLITVDQLIARWSIGTRSLQRLFQDQVGICAKRVITRFRIHEVIESLAAGAPADWTRLALDLGYYDQAHFIHDFKGLVGCTPVEYTQIRRPVAAVATSSAGNK